MVDIPHLLGPPRLSVARGEDVNNIYTPPLRGGVGGGWYYMMVNCLLETRNQEPETPRLSVAGVTGN